MRLLLARQFLDMGYAVDIVLADEEHNVSEYVPADVRVFNLGAERTRKFLNPFVKYLRDEKPDAVLAAMWPFTSVCIAGHRLARSKARIVVSDHNTLSVQYAKWGFKLLMAMRVSLAATYRFADARVAVSSGVADDLAKLSLVGRSKFEVIHNPMPLQANLNEDTAVAEAVWRGRQGKRIITIGRLKEQKNHAMLIRAIKLLSKEVDAALMIVGTGELEEETQRLITEENMQDRVIMAGHVPNPIPFYLAADLFVLSSDYEGFGNVIVEAMACGLPIVSTDCLSGPAEILEDGRHGILTPVGDEVAMASAIAEALKRPVDKSELQQRAADFTPENAARRYVELLFPK